MPLRSSDLVLLDVLEDVQKKDDVELAFAVGHVVNRVADDELGGDLLAGDLDELGVHVNADDVLRSPLAEIAR